MKTKSFLLLFLLLGFGLTQLSGQKGNNPTGNYSERVEVKWDGYWMPIVCDGNFVDYLYGSVTVYCEYHYVGGVPAWLNYHTIGEAKSTSIDNITGSGENFTVKENDFKQVTDQGVWPRYLTIHFNLNGDLGHHYQGTVTMDTWNPNIDDSPMTVIKFQCH
jgi:hypothetical protein